MWCLKESFERSLRDTKKQLVLVNEPVEWGLALCFQKSLAIDQSKSCKFLGWLQSARPFPKDNNGLNWKDYKQLFGYLNMALSYANNELCLAQKHCPSFCYFYFLWCLTHITFSLKFGNLILFAIHFTKQITFIVSFIALQSNLSYSKDSVI